MQRIIAALGSEPFSDKEIMLAVEGKANLVIYTDLYQYRSIDELLGPYRACILLYVVDETPESIYGHWVCIHEIKRGVLEFFDSYGIIFDSELDFNDNPPPPYLTYLLDRSNYTIIYSTHKLQRDNKSVSTCGRWVSWRLNQRHVPLAKFAAIMESDPHNSPDTLVTLLTAYIK